MSEDIVLRHNRCDHALQIKRSTGPVHQLSFGKKPDSPHWLHWQLQHSLQLCCQGSPMMINHYLSLLDARCLTMEQRATSNAKLVSIWSMDGIQQNRVWVAFSLCGVSIFSFLLFVLHVRVHFDWYFVKDETKNWTKNKSSLLVNGVQFFSLHHRQNNFEIGWNSVEIWILFWFEKCCA